MVLSTALTLVESFSEGLCYLPLLIHHILYLVQALNKFRDGCYEALNYKIFFY